jgi:signal peptidase I
MGVHLLRREIAVVTVSGASMQPTLTSGDRVLVRRARTGRPQTGQIVVIGTPVPDESAPIPPPRWPPGANGWMIKRVAATAGERAPEVMLTGPSAEGSSIVPAGKLAVLGDNRTCSLDSRSIGYIPEQWVLGVMVRPLTSGDRRGEHFERMPIEGTAGTGSNQPGPRA